MCFMTSEEHLTKVSTELEPENCDLTMDELASVFEELQERYEISKVQNKKLRKEKKILKNKLDIVSRKKRIYQFALKRLKRILILTSLFARAKALKLFLTKMCLKV